MNIYSHFQVNAFICGDFNIDLLAIGNGAADSGFLDTLAANSFLPLITKPTRITDISFSLINNIFSTNLTNISSGVILSDLSDHYPVYAIIGRFFNKEVPEVGSKIVRCRVLTKRTISAFYNATMNSNFSDVFECTNVDDGFETFYFRLLSLYDTHCPVITKHVSYKDDIKPWIDYDVKMKIKKRHNYHVLQRVGKMSREAYCRYRNMVTSEIRKKKMQYYNSKFSNFRNNLRETWKTINEVIKPNSGIKNFDFKLLNEGTVVTNANKVSTLFNKYFTSIGPSIGLSAGNPQANYRRFLTGNYVSSFFFYPVSSETVNTIINNLKNKSYSLKEISVSVLKEISNLISPILYL